MRFACARDFLIEGAFGEPVSLHDLRGRVVLLDWSAPWCGPCVTQANVLEDLFQDYKDRDVVIVSVVMDEDAQGVDWYGRPNPIECLNWEDRPDPFLDHTFPCWVDEFTTGGFRRAFPLFNQHDTFPTNTILDTGMRVVYNGAGYIEPTIEAMLDALVGSTDSCLH